MRPEFDIFTERQLAHGRFGSLAERLAPFWRINKSDRTSSVVWRGSHVDRVAV